MNAVAILVPTYTGHLTYFQQFVHSCEQCRVHETADLWTVVTDEEEAEHYPGIHTLVLPENLRENSTRGIINKKKFYGLMQLQENYRYIIVLDDDTVVNRPADLQSVCDKYFEKKILYGNAAKDREIFPKVIDSCLTFYTREQGKVFRKEAKNLYLWFNQPAIYECGSLTHFFQVTDMDRRLPDLCWHDFDYYVYMMYLVLYRGFRVEPIGGWAMFGICEALGNADCEIEDQRFFQQNALQMTEYLADRTGNDRRIFTIHVDRIYKANPEGSWLKRLLGKLRRMMKAG